MPPKCEETVYIRIETDAHHQKIDGHHNEWGTTKCFCHLDAGHTGEHETTILAEQSCACTFRWK